VIEQGHAGTGVGDLLLEAEGTARGVGIHDEDQIEEAGLADAGFCRSR
jgi:hypothetical protein